MNQGDLVLVELLLKTLSVTNSDTIKSSEVDDSKSVSKLDVNQINEQCMNATPLHLAVWNDSTEIAIRLVQSKADPNLKMNGKDSAFDLALQNKNEVLYDLLGDYHQKAAF